MAKSERIWKRTIFEKQILRLVFSNFLLTFFQYPVQFLLLPFIFLSNILYSSFRVPFKIFSQFLQNYLPNPPFLTLPVFTEILSSFLNSLSKVFPSSPQVDPTTFFQNFVPGLIQDPSTQLRFHYLVPLQFHQIYFLPFLKIPSHSNLSQYISRVYFSEFSWGRSQFICNSFPVSSKI